ncbi:MAG: MFS transporter [Thermoprotei archaeon]
MFFRCVKFPPSPTKLLVSITFSRVIYTFCWFDAAAASPALVAHQHYNYAELGELLSAFMVGSGGLQVPAGIYSARNGASSAVTIGLGLIAVGSLTSALSPSLLNQVVTRFITGVGAAFFFAPAMVLVSNLYRGRSGLMIGVYNAAFNLGGGITLITMTPAAAALGWRAPYLITGVSTLVALAQYAAVFRGIKGERSTDTEGIIYTIRSRTVWGVALSILGLSVVYYIATQFLVDYANNTLGLSATTTGLLSSFILFGGLVGGPLIGSISDRSSDRRIYVVLPIVLAGLSTALLSYTNQYNLALATTMLGFFDSAAYTIAYTIPTDIDKIGSRYAPLAIGLINSVSILSGAVGIILFGYSVSLVGYKLSWVVCGTVAALFLPFLRMVETRKNIVGDV